MDEFNEAEIQTLIALIELEQPEKTPNNIDYEFYPQSIEQAEKYFRKFLVDWTDAYRTLLDRGLLVNNHDGFLLTDQGEKSARQLRKERPPIWYWYREYYQAAQTSKANAIFCERLYGKNLCQQGFVDMQDLNDLLKITRMNKNNQVLDLGCGNGMITEHISDMTGARITGIDYIPEAIQQAQERTRSKNDRLSFQVGNMDRLNFPGQSFDTILSIDSIYMPNDLSGTIRQMKEWVKPGGQMAIFYSYALPENQGANEDSLSPEKTPLATTLQRNELQFVSWDLTHRDYLHALRKEKITKRLKDRFESEGNDFLYGIRISEASGVRKAIESGTHVRYLYRVSM
jgi:ubiquinone/menaquinone biosynthesis C-methylase UbiE